jgi:hypothetical protein
MDNRKMRERVLELSEEDRWEDAKEEWFLERGYRFPEGRRCLCGRSLIESVNIIRNRENGNAVGVCDPCRWEFLDPRIGDAGPKSPLPRAKDAEALDEATLEYAFARGWISDFERRFSIAIMTRQHPSLHKRTALLRLGRKILLRMARDPN